MNLDNVISKLPKSIDLVKQKNQQICEYYTTILGLEKMIVNNEAMVNKILNINLMDKSLLVQLN